MSERSTAGASHRLVGPASIGALGLALIMVGQVGPNRHAIQDDLTSRSAQALKSAELTGLSVSFSGRDATISGATTADRADKAVAVVGAVDGVRVAKADLPDGSSAPAAAAPTEAPAATETPAAVASAAETSGSVTTPAAATAETAAAKALILPVGFTLADGTITVTGTVRSAADGTGLIDAVTAAGNGWKIVNRLQVEGSLTAAAPPASSRLPAVTQLLAQAPIDGTRLVIQYSGRSVILRGAPANAATEFALLAAAAATVDNKSAVVDGLDTP